MPSILISSVFIVITRRIKNSAVKLDNTNNRHDAATSHADMLIRIIMIVIAIMNAIPAFWNVFCLSSLLISVMKQLRIMSAVIPMIPWIIALITPIMIPCHHVPGAMILAVPSYIAINAIGMI